MLSALTQSTLARSALGFSPSAKKNLSLARLVAKSSQTRVSLNSCQLVNSHFHLAWAGDSGSLPRLATSRPH